MTRRIGSLCTGYGGLDLAVHEVLGGELAWLADNDPGAAAILKHRFPSVPNLGDITAADWAAVEPVDVLTAGFPCQDVSCAGGRAGLREGNRTGVWAHVARAIDELRPSLVVLENVRGLLSAGADSDMELCPWCLGEAGDEHALRAAGAVLGDLADLGFDAEWAVVSAADAGAPHRRERVFILAWPAADAAGPVRGRLGSGRSGLCGAGLPSESGNGRVPAEDPDRAAGGQWRQPAPGQAPGGRPRADIGGSGGASVAADTAGDGTPGNVTVTADGKREAREGSRPGDRLAAADPLRGGRGGDEGDEGRRPERRDATDRDSAPGIGWGAYGAAIRHWEHITGRPAPRPTEPGRTGQRLSQRFVEWMQGLPEGWVTDVPGLSRNAQLKALGNGVVPQQAAMALRMLLERAPEAWPREDPEAGEAA